LKRDRRILALFLAAAVVAAGQTTASFEVTSVKPSADGETRTFGPRPGGRFLAKHVTLRTLIALAYNVREDRISGGPDWINTAPWNVEGKAREGSVSPGAWPDFWPDPAHPDDILTPMVASLLEERFQLKARRQMQEAPVYELRVEKKGAKLKSTANQEFVGRGAPRGTMLLNIRLGYFAGNGLPVARLALALSEPGALGRPVIDKTGLTGSYDFVLEWAPAPELSPAPPSVPTLTPDAAASRPSIFGALEEQLGLKVESTKGPVPAVVIEHVAKPSEN
jgi:uncharacterized protein (TIGR03435 family)